MLHSIGNDELPAAGTKNRSVRRSSNSGQDDVIENVSGIMTQQNPDNSDPASKVSTRKRSQQSNAAMLASSDAPNLPLKRRGRPASGRANATNKKA
ncbi:hypothetical protein ABBQ32_008816 [Trebouxia sp. C0010 RCD-2024]